MLDNFSLEATRTPKDIADLELSGSELICGIRPLVLHKKCLDPGIQQKLESESFQFVSTTLPRSSDKVHLY